MLDIQTPRMTYEPVSDTLGRFEVEPLDRGFGHTFGNSLRRVLLSSLEGAAVTSVRIEGVQHEFTTIPGLREDVTDVILNLRELVCRLHGEVGRDRGRALQGGPRAGHGRRHLGPGGPRDPQPGARDREPRGRRPARHDPDDLPRPRLRRRRAQQGPGHHDRRHPGRLQLLARAAGALRDQPRPRGPAHGLRQAHPRDRDRRQHRPARRDVRGRRDAHRPARDLRRPGAAPS